MYYGCFMDVSAFLSFYTFISDISCSTTLLSLSSVWVKDVIPSMARLHSATKHASPALASWVTSKNLCPVPDFGQQKQSTWSELVHKSVFTDLLLVMPGQVASEIPWCRGFWFVVICHSFWSSWLGHSFVRVLSPTSLVAGRAFVVNPFLSLLLVWKSSWQFWR